MGKVYRNKPEIPIPDFAYLNNHDARVYVIIDDEDGTPHQRIIGYATSPKTMAPNERFRVEYRELWDKAYPDDKAKPCEMHLGMYAMTIAASSRTGLYKILQDVYGLQSANAILDYSMFSVMYRSNVTQVYEDEMADQVIFSDRLHTDSWYSSFFKNDMTEDMNHQFRIRWVQSLAAQGLKKIWLCIDGSNNDCEAGESGLAEFGHPKSHNKNKRIVGYIYAVDSDTGRPITYFVYEGSIPDCQAFQKISTFLSGFGIRIEGVVLDRGFATEPVIATIESFQWKYVIMLPGDTYGHARMVAAHGMEIRWNSKYIVDDGGGLFGISDRMQLFTNSPRVSSISTFFDGVSGSHQSVRLNRKILDEKRRLGQAIAKGRRAAVARGLQKYISIEGDGSRRKVVSNYDAWDRAMNEKGFFSMATSDGITAKTANAIYMKRDASEKQYRTLKSQEGCNSTGVHYTAGIYSKHALAFIASIIRFEIESACQQLNLDTNPAIMKLDRIVLISMSDGSYSFVKNLTMPQKELFAKFGISNADMEFFAKDFNYRNTHAVKSQVHAMPEHGKPVIRKKQAGPGRPKFDTSINESSQLKNEEKSKSKGGRPKGVKDSKPRKPRSDKGKKREKRKRN